MDKVSAKASQDGGPTFILVILPESAAEPKAAVKRWGDIVRGVATQCIVSMAIITFALLILVCSARISLTDSRVKTST